MFAFQLRKFSCGSCKFSPRARSLAIGWFNFLVCLIPLVAIVWYAVTGAKGLDRFLHNTADLSSTKVEYVKAVAGFENARSLVSDIKYNEVKYKQARDKATWNNQEDDIFKNFDDPLWDHWRELRPKIILSDIICDGALLKLAFRVLFVAGGVFGLWCIGTVNRNIRSFTSEQKIIEAPVSSIYKSIED